MEFMIKRTSLFQIDRPCEGAYLGKYTHIDTRTTDDPSKVRAYQGIPTDWWYGDGTNHRVENGEIKRDFEGREAWFIEVNSLEELVKLRETYGDVILSIHFWNPEIPTIEIYDAYRE